MHHEPMAPEGENEVLREMRLRWEARLQEAHVFLQENPLVGLTVDEARRLTSEAGIAFRTAFADEPILSADMQPGRITAMEKDGVVVSAEVGN